MYGKYNTAEWVLSAITMVSWLGMAIGAYAIYWGGHRRDILLGLSMGGPIIAICAVLIAIAQIARAQIDTAVATADILAFMKKQAVKAEREAAEAREKANQPAA